MNLVRFFPTLGLSAALMAQSAAPSASPVKRNPQIRYAQHFGLLPQIVDGNDGSVVWSTAIKVVNLSSISNEPWEVDFYDETGTPLAVSIQGQGFQTSLKGTLAPGQTASFVTTGASTSKAQTSWGALSASTGADISTYETLRDAVASAGYLGETSVSVDYGVYNQANSSGGFLPFDNTVGSDGSKAFTAVAVVNPVLPGTPPTGTDTLLVEVIDSNGNLIAIANGLLQVTQGTHRDFLVQNQWPETKGITGTLRFLPSTGTFSPVSILALQGSTSGTYKTLTTVNLLQTF